MQLRCRRRRRALRFALGLVVSDRHRRFPFCLRGDLRHVRDRPRVARSDRADFAHFAEPARASALRAVFGGAHQRRLCAEPACSRWRTATSPRVRDAPKLFSIPLLDILQSIPVLSFLPGVMLAMVAIFPHKQIGVELGSILLIFTGQVWNIAFSFYSSLKGDPREMREAAIIYRFSQWQKFVELDLPFSTIGLVWNSMMSVAGGWFFLMACEMFVLGDRDFRLPGLGSFLQTAAGDGDTRAILWGLAAMVGVIVLMDQLIWRPVIAWAEKFKFEQVESASQTPNTLLRLLGRASFVIRIYRTFVRPFANRLMQNAAVGAERASRKFTAPKQDRTRKILLIVLGAVILVGLGFAVFHAGRELSDLHRADYFSSVAQRGAALSFA